MKIRRGNLRTKIIAWSFVPTVIILAAVALVTFNAYQQVTEELVIERDRELVRLSASQLAAELRDYTATLTEYTALLADLAHTTDTPESEPAAQRAALSQARSRVEIFDAGVIILNNYGTVVATEPERPDVMGQNWSDRPYFRQMLRFPEPIFSDIVSDGPGGVDVIVVAVPIKGAQGQFLGVIAGMFRVDATTISPFYNPITRLRIGQTGSAYLVDGNGRVIYHSETDRIGDDLAMRGVVQRVLKGDVGSLRTRDVDNRDIVAGFAPVPGTAWGLVTQESWAALISASEDYRKFLLLLLGLGVVVPALVVAVGVRRITQPIAELISATQEVAGGHFGQTITAQTGDELEELARQFSLMSAQLQETVGALRESEVRHRSLFDGAQVGLYRTTPAGRFLDANPALVQILDYPDRETLLRTNLADLYVNPQDRVRWKELVEREEVERNFETRLRRHDGTVVWINDAARAVKDERGEVLYYEGSVENITERKHAERELQKHRHHLEELVAERTAALTTVNEQLQREAAEREKLIAELDAFAHTVAHNLQNPLTTVIGFAHLLQEDADTMSEENLQQCLQTVARVVRKMSNITQELLLLASVRKGEVKTAPLDMTRIISEAQKRLAYLIEESQAEIVVATDWPVALGYTPWVEEVWANYLSNAIKYGGQPPRVELGATVQGDGWVRFWVHDNGRGLTPEEQARLFTPFTRLDQVRAKGYGLGLTIVHRIVEKLGGQVGVESDGVPGHGSVFYFTLPGAV